MQYSAAIILFVILATVVSWDCPPNQKQQLNGDSFPGKNSSYSPNLRCIFEIVVPQGQYINLIVSSNIAAGDSLLFTDYGTLYLPYTKIGNLELASPRTITISFNSSSTTNGSLAFIWYYNKLPFDTRFPMRETVAPSRVGVIMLTHIVYTNPYVISSEKDDIVLAVAGNSVDPSNYKLTSTFVFEGEGVNGKYLGSFYSMLNTGYFQCNTKKITVVSVSNMECGMGLAKVYSDVKDYNYRVAYDYNLDDSIILDGRTKPDAITIFSQNAENVYMSSPNFSTTTGSLEWQSEDLRPNSIILTSYQVDDSRLNKLPQALPGYMKTLSSRNAHVTIPISMVRPAIYNNVTTGAGGIFTSRNFGAPKMMQRNWMELKSGERQNLTFNVLEAYNNTVFFLKITDGNQTITKNVKAKESYSVMGFQFEFSYNVTFDFQTFGGISTFQFGQRSNITGDDKASRGLYLSLLFAAFIISMS